MSILDIATIIVLLMVTCVTLFFASYMLDQLSQIEMVQENTEAAAQLTQMSGILHLFNNYLPYLLIALFIVTLIGAYFIETHPIFFAVSLVSLGIMVIFSGSLVHIFNQFAQIEQFSEVIGDYETIIITWQSMPGIVLIMGAALTIVLYAKWKRGGFRGPVQ